MPARARIAPSSVNSNTPNGARPCFCPRVSASRLDEVPIRVHTPPICAAYAIGISTRAGGCRARARAQRQRQEGGDQRDVLHERAHRRDGQHHRQGQQPRLADPRQPAAQRFQRAGALDAQAQREHRGHGDRGLVAETAQGIVEADDPQHDQQRQHQQRDRSMRIFSLAKAITAATMMATVAQTPSHGYWLSGGAVGSGRAPGLQPRRPRIHAP